MKLKLISGLLLSVGVMTQSFAATPFFTITPIDAGTQSNPQLISSGQTVAATYKVTNMTGQALTNIHLDTRTLVSNGVVTQDTTSNTFSDQCAANFSLASGQSCTLRLLVTGAVDQTAQTYGTPGICYGNNLACSQPLKADRLYVSTATDAPWVTINSVKTGKMEGDTLASEFSVIVDFTNGANKLSNWQIGFYMPRSFAILVSNTEKQNQRLTMQICADAQPTDCANVVRLQAKSITDQDESTGYTTLLAPATAFPLSPNAKYTLKLLHSNTWDPGNYSAVPQSFFMINNGIVSNLPTTASTYTLVDYNAADIAQNIKDTLADHWEKSNNLTASLNVIPEPTQFVPIAESTETYRFANGVAIHNTLNANNTVANFFAADLKTDLGIQASVDNAPLIGGGIVIYLGNNADLGHSPEAYQISIKADSIQIDAFNNTGVFYALQTLRQLWNANEGNLPLGTIIDYPHFKYRGVLLDTARHFFSVDEIKKLIDVASAHKLNTLHLHFTDDEAFRIGLTNYYNQIAEKADTRGYPASMMALMFIQQNLDITNVDAPAVPYPYVNTAYSGTYSEGDIHDLISYANARGMTIIPEIDMPGHIRALIKAFPDALVDPNDTSTFYSVQGYNDDVLPVCTYNTDISVGSKFTTLIDDIVSQTQALFSNQSTPYAENELSVGGDEVSAGDTTTTGAWSKDTSCTGTWSSLTPLQKSHKFFGLLAAQHPSLKFSGWQQYIQNDDDSLGSDIVPAVQAGHVWVWNPTGEKDAVPMGIQQAVNLAENGYPTVLAFADKTYFDLTYVPDVTEPGFMWAGRYLDTYSALLSAASAKAVQDKLSDETRSNIVGLEGTLWSENIGSYEHMMYMALPKMAGLAEAGWSTHVIDDEYNKVNWKDLATRLGCGQTGYLAYLHKIYGVKYRGYPNGIKKEIPEGTCEVITPNTAPLK